MYGVVLSPQFPPLGVVILLSNGAAKHLPAPMVDHLSKRQEKAILHWTILVRALMSDSEMEKKKKRTRKTLWPDS